MMPLDFRKCRFVDRLQNLKKLSPGTVYIEFSESRVGDDGYGNMVIHHPSGLRKFLCRVLRWLENKIRKIGTIDYDRGYISLNGKWGKKAEYLDIYYLYKKDFEDDN